MLITLLRSFVLRAHLARDLQVLVHDYATFYDAKFLKRFGSFVRRRRALVELVLFELAGLSLLFVVIDNKSG
jgi:hypothetical protein